MSLWHFARRPKGLRGPVALLLVILLASVALLRDAHTEASWRYRYLVEADDTSALFLPTTHQALLAGVPPLLPNELDELVEFVSNLPVSELPAYEDVASLAYARARLLRAASRDDIGSNEADYILLAHALVYRVCPRPYYAIAYHKSNLSAACASDARVCAALLGLEATEELNHRLFGRKWQDLSADLDWRVSAGSKLRRAIEVWPNYLHGHVALAVATKTDARGESVNVADDSYIVAHRRLVRGLLKALGVEFDDDTGDGTRDDTPSATQVLATYSETERAEDTVAMRTLLNLLEVRRTDSGPTSLASVITIVNCLIDLEPYMLTHRRWEPSYASELQALARSLVSEAQSAPQRIPTTLTVCLEISLLELDYARLAVLHAGSRSQLDQRLNDVRSRCRGDGLRAPAARYAPHKIPSIRDYIRRGSPWLPGQFE